MPRKTADLKAEIESIAGNKAAAPDKRRQAAAATTAADAEMPPATDRATPDPSQAGEPLPSPAAANGDDTPAAAPERKRKRHRGPHINVRLDEEMHEAVKQMAADVERSVENMVRRILRRAIRDHKAARANATVDSADLAD